MRNEMTQNNLLSMYSIPPFEDVKPEHLAEAFDDVLITARSVFEDIISNESPSSFENSVAVYDDLFQDLMRLMNVLAVFELNAFDDTIKQLSEEQEKKLTDFNNDVFQNQIAAKRFQDVYDRRHELKLDEEDLWFLQNIYWDFEAAGTFLNEVEQKRLKEIDGRLIELSTQFIKNLDEARIQNAVFIADDDINKLDGVPDDVISGMQENAKEAGHISGYLFIPERLLVGDLLSVAHNRDFRQKIHEAMYNIGRVEPYDNRDVIKEMQKYRHERAQVLGYDNYAEYHLSQTMAGSVDRVQDVVKKTVCALTPAYESDIAKLQEWASQKDNITMKPWDMAYYAAQYKRDKFDFDENELNQYFELENVMNGWVSHVEKSMNVSLSPINDVPRINPDVRAYRVMDNDSGKETVLYFDLFARPKSKSGGAWMHDVQLPDEQSNRPNIVMLNLNLIKPSDDTHVLMNISQIETLYHEGGHGLNGIKGVNTKYRTRAGVSSSSDFVEIPSMIEENWCMHPDVFATYAFHHKTGEVVPDSLIEAMTNSSQFMASASLLLLVQNSLRDIVCHSIDPSDFIDDVTVESMAAIDTPHIDLVRPYPLARFDHLFSGALSSYAAGYYGYFWSDVAQAQAFDSFSSKGIYDDELSALKKEFFSAGASVEPNKTYETFTGMPAGDPTALLKRKGLII
jgi:peptidyl-dipeptidase Dcp